MNVIRLFFVFIFAMCSVVIDAQSQQGVVKTKGRIVNGKYVAGQGLAGATVSIQGRSAVLTQGNGGFSFPVPNKTFMVQSVKKQGYQLVDADAAPKAYTQSSNPLFLVMETPEQQAEDKLTAERKIRRTLQRQLKLREDELKELKAQNKLTQEEYRKRLEQLYDDQQNNEKLIASMAKEYSQIDYDQLDELNRQISEAILNGDLTRADSLLRSKGDINSRVAEVRKAQKAEAKEEAELSQRQTYLTDSKEGTKKKLEDLAQDCKNYFDRFKMSNQHDSAAYYIELRAELDTTNVIWQNQAGLFIDYYLADYAKAIVYYQRVLRQSQAQFGDKDNWVATAYHNIGTVYFRQDSYTQALEYFQKALEISKVVLGERHPDVAVLYGDIGIVYNRQGYYDQALEFHQKSMEIKKDILGERHLNVASSYNNIGRVYEEQGFYAQALEYFQKALEISKEVLGERHLEIAEYYNNIGTAYHYQGSYIQAHKYYQKALEIKKDVLGESHPDVALIYNNIGRVYFDQGANKQALEYFQKAFLIVKEVFGEHHSKMATIYHNIGLIYYSQGSYPQALEYFKKALEISKETLGENHPDVAANYSCIGGVYTQQGFYDQALEYLQKAIEIDRKVLGERHPNVARDYDHIGEVYYWKYLYDQALDYYKKALEIKKEVLGERHLDVAASYNNIGLVYYSQNSHALALEYYQKSLEIKKEFLDESHPDMATTYHNIGLVYFYQGTNQQALEFFQKAQQIQEVVLGVHHPTTIYNQECIEIAKYNLAILEGNSKSYREDYCFIATIVDGNTPAKKLGMEGEYILLEFADWNHDSTSSLFEKSKELQGKPKDILVMKGSEIKRYHFENSIGAQLGLKHVGMEERIRINKAYEEWKKKGHK